VQVRCNEGVAIRIGPEPCVGVREDDGEASAGGAHRPAMEPRKLDSPGRRRVQNHGRRHERRRDASLRPARRGRRTWHVRKLFAREPGGLGFGLRMDAAGSHREDEES
jgi:hypothetical protein